MRINAIGHATWLLETSVGTILTDPVFFDPFEAGANVSYPVRVVYPARLPKIDCVFLSHRHFDHFDVRTLATLDRNAMVFYPAGEALLETALDELGFTRRTPLQPWAKARLGHVEIIGTPSLVGWPELGLFVRDGGTTLWSLVDSVTDADIVGTVLNRVGRVDCLLAQYSPLFQYELRNPATLRTSDVDEYRWLLRIIELTLPQVVIPSAGGLRYAWGEWQNAYGFPITPHRFLDDVQRIAPESQRILLQPGDRCELADGHGVSEPRCLEFVYTEQQADGYARWQLDPAAGIPAFTDINPLASPVGPVWDYAIVYITGHLVDDLRHSANAEALAEWRQWNTLWRIDLYAPPSVEHRGNGTPPARSWWLDLRGEIPRLAETGPVEVTGRTAVAASGIYDLLHGRCSTYAYLFTDRTRHSSRVHHVTAEGVTAPASELPEPVLRALTGPRDLDALYVRAQLDQWCDTA